MTSATVGAVGFCMGGGFVLMLAAQQGDKVGAAVPFYGVAPALPGPCTGLTAPRCRATTASRTPIYPPEPRAARTSRSESESGADAKFFFYPAGHAFHNDENLLGTYDAEQAALAWSRTTAFLRENLG